MWLRCLESIKCYNVDMLSKFISSTYKGLFSICSTCVAQYFIIVIGINPPAYSLYYTSPEGFVIGATKRILNIFSTINKNVIKSRDIESQYV